MISAGPESVKGNQGLTSPSQHPDRRSDRLGPSPQKRYHARVSPPDPDAIRTALLAWWDIHSRELPWRNTRDPYAIWVSEIMLQQTRVQTVIPYYLRFLKQFPTVWALAKAPEQKVLKAWEGLGYYRRARNLHAAARQLATESNGRLPPSVEGLRSLPGIGRYTAGAIASIAFDLDEPVLDGNVIRVLSRVYCCRGDVTKAATRNELWQRAEELVPPGQAGRMNQAIMDLGAMVCLPRKPHCDACPLARTCLARKKGIQEQLPVKPAAAKVPHYDIAAGIVWKRGRVLIDQRKPDALLGGLWEFPGGKQREGETPEQAAVREVAEETGLTVRPGEVLATIRHAYSHFRITLRAVECTWVSGQARAIECEQVRWVWPSQLGRYPFPKANARLLPLLQR